MSEAFRLHRSLKGVCMSCSFRRALTLVVSASVLASLVPAAALAAPSSGTAVRPSVAIVKRGLTKTWDLDKETSVDKITLVWRSVKLLKTRKAVPYRDFVEPGKWVTPVTAVFDQKTVRTSYDVLNDTEIRSCFTYRVTFSGIFWKGDFGWKYKNRDVTAKQTAYQYRCT